jgi:hypothetical protein
VKHGIDDIGDFLAWDRSENLMSELPERQLAQMLAVLIVPANCDRGVIRRTASYLPF